jgi:hypothetical protein
MSFPIGGIGLFSPKFRPFRKRHQNIEGFATKFFHHESEGIQHLGPVAGGYFLKISEFIFELRKRKKIKTFNKYS